jgi:flagellar basal-body rod protein FlgC
MSELMKSMGAAASGMAAQSARLRLSAENIANVDTPGYRRKLASFEVIAREDGGVVKAGRVRLDRSDLPQVYDPSHPLADAQGYVEGSTVDLMVELADAREAQRSYEANIKMMDQARAMTSGLMDLLRR